MLGDQLLHEESWASTQLTALSEKEQQEHCQSPTNVLQLSTGAHVSDQTVRHRDEGVLEWDLCPTCVPIKGLAQSTGICQRIPELAGLTLVACSLHRRELGVWRRRTLCYLLLCPAR